MPLSQFVGNLAVIQTDSRIGKQSQSQPTLEIVILDEQHAHLRIIHRLSLARAVKLYPAVREAHLDARAPNAGEVSKAAARRILRTGPPTIVSMTTITPLFSVPFVFAQHPQPEPLNATLHELFLARETEDARYANPNPYTVRNAQLFESLRPVRLARALYRPAQRVLPWQSDAYGRRT